MFANIIIDISHEKVDRTFQYRIPARLENTIEIGMQVLIPFGAGNRNRKGYVVGLTNVAEYDESKQKEVAGIADHSVTAQSQLIMLAWWMRERYGSTMNQALKTVLPVKQKIKAMEKKSIRCLLDKKELSLAIAEAQQKKYKARVRLLKLFEQCDEVPYQVVNVQMNISLATLKPLEEKHIIAVERKEVYRNPLGQLEYSRFSVKLNPGQEEIVQHFCREYDKGIRKTCLIHGITGSGKTEVYMELIAHVMDQGKQVIVLIPEIALTYQTVMRFYKRFGSCISIINSKLSAGERFDQFERARNGDIDIMIGPRSALFTPFERLGLIIIDEEHEGAYKSETAPRYHAREVAIKRAGMNDASVVLGSATPSTEAYSRALKGEYHLYTMSMRAKENSRLADVCVVDLREELKSGNKSIFSRQLQSLMEDRLQKKEQMMLFLNRRGYAGFVSCRACGEAIRCPHCDVSLTLHNNSRLICHYCGYEIPMPKSCPSCQSPYIAGFGVGTQKIQQMIQGMYPDARVLRMDFDTTSKKGGHEEILTAFAEGEADILIGTQMIVKGHDFPLVTLVGVLAADLSLYTADYASAERTFQLLTQAAGRAGRGNTKGDVVIQTYAPDHYSIKAAAQQDYSLFYEQEMAYRSMLRYPPVVSLFTIQLSSKSEDRLGDASGFLAGWLENENENNHLQIQVIGPVDASVYKVNDIYRKILYLKHENYDILIRIKNQLEQLAEQTGCMKQVMIAFDFSS